MLGVAVIPAVAPDVHREPPASAGELVTHRAEVAMRPAAADAGVAPLRLRQPDPIVENMAAGLPARITKLIRRILAAADDLALMHALMAVARSLRGGLALADLIDGDRRGSDLAEQRDGRQVRPGDADVIRCGRRWDDGPGSGLRRN